MALKPDRRKKRTFPVDTASSKTQNRIKSFHSTLQDNSIED